MDIALLGLPGAGKGTQAALLATELGVPHIATGNIFRQAAADGTPLGLRVRAIMEEGRLVPDALTVAVIRERLQAADCAPGAVLDGFPRTLAQATALDGLLGDLGRALRAAVYLVVDEARAVERLSGRRVCPQCGATYHLESTPPLADGRCRSCGVPVVQRADDAPAAQSQRLMAYREATEPVLAYYRDRGRLREVDGDRSVADVASGVLAAVRIGGGA